MAIRAIVFDLYGVLGLNGWQAFKVKHFADRPEAWDHLRALGQRVDAGELPDSELVDAVAQTTGEPAETIRYQFEHTMPNTDMLNFIAQELKPRYKIGLLSNASKDVFGTIFNSGQQQMFDAAVSSFHVGLTKPDPAMFQLICNRLGVRPDECIMVDDQERHIDSAKSMGMVTVLFKTVSQTEMAIRKELGLW